MQAHNSAHPTQNYLALDPMLKRHEVERVTALFRSNLYRRIQEGTFPAPVRLGPRSVAWRQSDIASWLASRPVGVRGGQA